MARCSKKAKMASRYWLCRRAGTTFALTILVLSSRTERAPAVERVYNIVTSQSNIAISGKVHSAFGTTDILPQGPGSLTTSYTGTIRADRAGTSSIQFSGGSLIDANVSGSWKPLATGDDGSAPADYGGRVSYLFGAVTANFAARDFVADLLSGALPIDSAGHFDLSTTTVTFVSGNLAYRSSLGQAGGETVTGKSSAMSGTATIGWQSQNGNFLETLLIPVNTTQTVPVDATTSVDFTLKGQLYATAALAAGDYNLNGTVDAADYVVWRKTLGSSTSLPADDSPGVGPDDYTRWRAQFAETGGSGAGTVLTGAAVPEPTALVTFLLSSAAWLIAPGVRAVGRNRC
jgi:hypothetical protein